MTLPKDILADFCRRYHIRRMALFGSHLHGTATENSDIDLLVEFEPGHTPGFLFFEMEAELTEILGQRVELHTAGFLSRYFRQQVLNEAEEVYAAP